MKRVLFPFTSFSGTRAIGFSCLFLCNAVEGQCDGSPGTYSILYKSLMYMPFLLAPISINLLRVVSCMPAASAAGAVLTHANVIGEVTDVNAFLLAPVSIFMLRVVSCMPAASLLQVLC